MAFPVVGVVIATVLFFVYLKLRGGKKKSGKELPGPVGLPFLGNVLQLGKFPNVQFCEWSKKYGDIYQANLAGQTVVIISEPKLAKELFTNDIAYTGKPQFEGFDMFIDDKGLGMFNSEGELWEVHRRFLLRQLRDFGFGKTAMESLITDEVAEVIQTFKSKQGKPVTQIRETLRLAVVNSLWTILTSKRFKHDDPDLIKLTLNTTKVFNELIENGSLLIFMPWLQHVIPEWSGYNRIRKVFDENRDVFMTAVEEHKAAFKEENQNDFIDVYLAEVRKTKDPKSAFYGERAEKNLANILFDLFIAGSDTTATTISWTVLYLCKFPEVQEKLQKEIDTVTGNSRKVFVTDRPNMPYTLALIDEILRFSSLVPDGVQHRVMADKEFHGYSIPKDAWVQPNLWFIHHNPQLWGDPENFRPERFIKDGKYQKSENMMAFQIGRRQCVGETLARDTIFLYVTNLFQTFNIAFDPTKSEPTLDSEPGFLRAPLPYTVLMTERSAKYPFA